MTDGNSLAHWAAGTLAFRLLMAYFAGFASMGIVVLVSKALTAA